MIFEGNSRRMLKYQKAKAKLVEYNVNKEEYPDFKLNSNDLSFSSTYILSRYAECVIEDNQTELAELSPLLKSVAQYYDAALSSQDRKIHDYNFWLSGSTAYFLANDFGCAKVLINKVFTFEHQEEKPQHLLVKVLGYLLLQKSFRYIKITDEFSKVNNNFLDYFRHGKNKESLIKHLSLYRASVYEEEVVDNVFYVDILYAVIIRAIEYSSWALLPGYSKLSVDIWQPYLEENSSMKILWPAQQLIGKKEILCGKNAIIQLPTGAGKTKGIELIIRTAFLADRADTVIVVAPLRALCNEITYDLQRVFGKTVNVNQFSDILQLDIMYLFDDEKQKQIIVCTPEKMSYIVHHQTDFLQYVDLFVFDEGHMFDDGSRGAMYELLVTHIKEVLSESQQFVLLSAVLPNAEQIKDWLFDDNGILASDPSIDSTPKSIGFTSVRRNVHFYTDNSREEDYFIPNVLRTEQLTKLPKERKERYFPELNEPFDVAIYNAIKLSPKGGVAIYLSQQRSIKTVLEKVVELDRRGYDLSVFLTHSDQVELVKISKLIEAYYGADHIYTKCSKFGILPHSSSIPNGIKLAVENALKNDYVRCVVCTSTLAQGVNIPIKYLLVTGMRNNSTYMKVRNFQNLIGRTARSGIYTEGSIIITDTKIYDNKDTYEKGGKYKWKNTFEMFDRDATEPCSSSILALMNDIKVKYDKCFPGIECMNYLLEHNLGDECFYDLTEKLRKAALEFDASHNHEDIYHEIMMRRDILGSIENFLCLLYSEASEEERVELSVSICRKLLAYVLADEEQKKLLERIFTVIAKKISVYSSEQLKRYSYTMTGVDLSIKIEKWIAEKGLTAGDFSEEELLRLILEFFKEIHQSDKYSEQFDMICELWIAGKTPDEIHQISKCDVAVIDDVCSKQLSYELNFFIGNICDLIEVDPEDDEQVDPTSTLSLLQKKVRYGVPTRTAITLCEKLFNDRVIVNELTDVIGTDTLDNDNYISVLEYCQESLFRKLDVYPDNFSNRLKFVLS